MSGSCRPFAALAALLFAATTLRSAAGGDPIEELVRQCDLVAEISVHSTATIRAEIRYSDAEWSSKFAAVPDENRFSKVLPAGPFNGWYESRYARVRTAIKGCEAGQTIAIDFNNYATDTNAPGENTLFVEDEHCLVFLRRYTNGHYGVLNLRDGKLPISGGGVPGWRASATPVALPDVLRQLREWVVAATQRRPQP
jgi:hypothetical protein